MSLADIMGGYINLKTRKDGVVKDAMHSGKSVVAVQQDVSHKAKKHSVSYCSICNNRIWFAPTRIREPDTVPPPRLAWVLCKECYGILLDEVRRSPIRTPLRLRIAVGIVAAERWPYGHPTRTQQAASDRRLILFIAISLIVVMLLHLVLIVVIAGLH
jgi:hypothetical protein